MSDECDSYESACSRAELLGSAPPSRHEWELANKDKGTTSATDDVTEEVQLDAAEGEQNAEPKRKLDELNNILAMTHLSMDKFKKACGSLTNLLKVRGFTEERADSPVAAGSSDNVEDAVAATSDALEKLQ